MVLLLQMLMMVLMRVVVMRWLIGCMSLVILMFAQWRSGLLH